MIRRLSLLALLGVFGTLAAADSAEACHKRKCGHRMRSSCYSSCYSTTYYAGGGGGGSCYGSAAPSYGATYPASYAAPSYPAPSGQTWAAPAPAPSPQAGNWQAAPSKVPPAPMMAPTSRAATPAPAYNPTPAPAANPAPAQPLPAAPAGGLQGAVPPPPPAPPNF